MNVTNFSDFRNYEKCWVLKAVKMRVTVIWDVTPCSLVQMYPHFRGIFCLPRHNTRTMYSCEPPKRPQIYTEQGITYRKTLTFTRCKNCVKNVLSDYEIFLVDQSHLSGGYFLGDLYVRQQGVTWMAQTDEYPVCWSSDIQLAWLVAQEKPVVFSCSASFKWWHYLWSFARLLCTQVMLIVTIPLSHNLSHDWGHVLTKFLHVQFGVNTASLWSWVLYTAEVIVIIPARILEYPFKIQNN
jgi:hypothetical protein